jgi:hypothetical protein
LLDCLDVALPPGMTRMSPGDLDASKQVARRAGGVIRERPTPAGPEMGTGLDRRFGWIAVPSVAVVADISKDGGTIRVGERPGQFGASH